MDDNKQSKKFSISSKHKDGETASSSSSSSKKSSFSFERFSFRRLFNSTVFNRNIQSGSRTRNKHSSKDTFSDIGPTTAKEIQKVTYCVNNSIDFESNSISSGQSDFVVSSSSSDYKYNNGNILISSCTMECPLCLMELPTECFPSFATCSHRACFNCLQQYLKIEISESRINITCPECIELIHPNDIKIILNDESFINKYENFMLRRVLITEPDARWCPAPDCGYVVIATGCASCPKLKCSRPGCDTSFCYHCKQEWHPNQTCDAARAQRNKKHQSSHSSYKQKSSSLTPSHDSLITRDDMKLCPCCKIPIIKMNDGSCNHMTCSICGTEFCWLCLKEISDLHYLSPSGCTFWGKKPWSRKKKIMWQLGMLIGAPVGIALIAGIAVPAIIIGLPVCVGRKLHSRYAKKPISKYKKNLIITTGVVTSVIISPILSAVAVGIGVPILLAYVYGVVPISLCRSGGCAVTTSSSGVKFEMDDEENEIGINVNTLAPDGVSVDTALGNKGVNPSIDGVSFGPSTSLSMGSNYHLDKTEVDQDASTNALAGSIASASKMHEVIQIDLSSNKRFSITSSGQQSETASNTLSFNYSVNMSMGDDASTKALAGSIVGYKDVCIGTTPTDSNGRAAIEINDDDKCHVYQNKICCCEDALSTKSAKINQNKTFNSKWVSFNQNGQNFKFGKYESRSCEQLTNYCSICNKTHRPCCPIYSLSIQSSSKSSSIEKQNDKNLKLSSDNTFLSSKKSIISTSFTSNKKRRELKRVKSSENSKNDKKIKPEKENKIKSTPTSPVLSKP